MTGRVLYAQSEHARNARLPCLLPAVAVEESIVWRDRKMRAALLAQGVKFGHLSPGRLGWRPKNRYERRVA